MTLLMFFGSILYLFIGWIYNRYLYLSVVGNKDDEDFLSFFKYLIIIGWPAILIGDLIVAPLVKLSKAVLSSTYTKFTRVMDKLLLPVVNYFKKGDK